MLNLISECFVFGFYQARIRLSAIIKDIIIERRKCNNVRPMQGGDLLNVILSKKNLSDEEMVSIVLDLLFGGYETTAKLLSLIVYFLGGASNALESLKVLCFKPFWSKNTCSQIITSLININYDPCRKNTKR